VPLRFLVGALVLVVWVVAAFTRADPDLWGHVRFGLDILDLHSIPSIDPYSFTQDRPWVNHEWLSEVLMGAAWSVGRTAGLAGLKGTLLLGACWVTWSALRGADFPARLGVMAAVAVGTLHVTATMRPQVWSLLAMPILARVLTGSGRLRWVLPPLFLVWANVHGGWIVGLGVLVAWSAGEILVRPVSARGWIPLVLTCAAVTLVNPYGSELWRFLIETVRVTRPQIEEWQPLWALSPAQWLPWMAVTGAWVWWLRPVSAHRWSRVFALALLAYGSFRVVRALPLYTVTAAVLVAPEVARRWPAQSSLQGLVRSRADQIVAVGLALGAVALAAGVGSRSLTCIASDLPGMPEPAPVQALSVAAAGSRVVTYFNWGEYALWHLGPGVRISMDGRRETVYSERRLDEHDAILFGRPEGFRVLADWRPEYVWLPAASRPTRDWLANNGYRIEMETEESFVATRDDLAPLNFRLQTSAFELLRRCFPS